VGVPRNLKDCIDELKSNKKKSNKPLDRSHIVNAIYVGDIEALLTYPMPRPAELNRDHFLWAESAGIV